MDLPPADRSAILTVTARQVSDGACLETLDGVALAASSVLESPELVALLGGSMLVGG